MSTKGMKNNLFSLLMLLAAGVIQAMPADSVGRKVSGGKYYLLHKISSGETLYGVCRKYGSTAGEVTAANPGIGTSFQIDKVIMIPRKWGITAGESSTSSAVNAAPANTSNAPANNPVTPRNSNTGNNGQTIRHQVAKGEALGIIARKYGVSIAAIKEENQLSSDNVRIGQILRIPSASSSAITAPVTTANQNGNGGNPAGNGSTDPLPKSNTPESSQVLVAPANSVRSGESRDPGMAGANTGKAVYEPVVDVNEEGKAIISNKDGLDQTRNFVIHPTARVGTIVMLTNPSNNVRVFARVVGNYRSSENPGASVQVTKVVADVLSGGAPEFPVKINYAR
ncbi:MAG: LysM peptidoglycan-binding domain-containing protein [Bacteroidetes bacterium]|nr:LysM peptidoglycan-binding domain-containing protein [Bacteroidota bacterium]